MPKFSTISPTCKPGKKPEAWARFRDGNYVAIGWCYETDLTGKAISDILKLIPEDHYDGDRDLRDAMHSFPVFWLLKPGDYLAVRNTNDGLFGIGKIESGYRYARRKHFTDVQGHWYPHFYEMKWVWTDYIKREQLGIAEGDNWIPFGTLSQLHEELPSYILPYIRF